MSIECLLLTLTNGRVGTFEPALQILHFVLCLCQFLEQKRTQLVIVEQNLGGKSGRDSIVGISYAPFFYQG